MTSLVRASLQKELVPANERRYVALMDFRSEELDESLDGLADAMGVFVVNDLASSPSIVVLERNSLERVTAEKALTGMDQEIATSGVLLEGGVKRGEKPDEMTVHIAVKSVTDRRTLDRIAVTGDAKDIMSLRMRTDQAIVEKLRARPLEQKTASREQEAETFIIQAFGILRIDPDRATRAAEAAVALEPSHDKIGRTIHIYQSAMSQFNGTFRRLWAGAPLQQRTEWAEKYLAQASRLHELNYKLLQLAKRENPESLHEVFLWGPAVNYGTFADLDSPELRNGTRKLVGACFKEYHEIINLLEDEGRQGKIDQFWFEILAGAVGGSHPLTENAGDWQKIVKEAVTLAVAPPFKTDEKYELMKRRSFNWSMYDSLPPQDFAPWGMHDGDEQTRVVMETLSWLEGQKDPTVRLCTLRAAIFNRWAKSDVVAADAGLRIIEQELPPVKIFAADHDTDEIQQLASLCWEFFGILSQHPEMRSHYLQHAELVLRPILTSGDDTLILKFTPEIEPWAKALKESNNLKEAFAVASACDKSLETLMTHPDLRLEVTIKRRPLQEILDELQAQMPSAQATQKESKESTGLEFTPMIDYEPKGWRVRGVAIEGDQVYLLLTRFLRDGRDLVRLTALPLAGGQEQVIKELELPGLRKGFNTYPDKYNHDNFSPAEFQELNRLSMIPDPLHTPWVIFGSGGNGMFYADFHNFGLVVFNDGKATVYTQKDGLPPAPVSAMAYMNGKFYLGVRPGAFLEYDPAAGKAREIASSRSQARRNIIDAPYPYTISGILPDPGRGCLWLTLQGHLEGLFRFDPAKNLIEKSWTPSGHVSGLLTSHGGGFVLRRNNAWFKWLPEKEMALTLVSEPDPKKEPVEAAFPVRLLDAHNDGAVVGDKLLLRADKGFVIYSMGIPEPIKVTKKPDGGPFGNFQFALSAEFEDGFVCVEYPDKLWCVRLNDGGAGRKRLEARIAELSKSGEQ